MPKKKTTTAAKRTKDDKDNSTSSSNSSMLLLVELTDGQTIKPVQVSVQTTGLPELKKEARKKLRKAFQYCYYYKKKNKNDATDDHQYLETDQQLQDILQQHYNDQELGGLGGGGGSNAAPCFFLCNKKKKMASTDSSVQMASNLVKDQEGPPQNNSSNNSICYVIGEELDTETQALMQLRSHAACLEGCLFAIGMPDLHAGKGIPIGAAVLTHESIAYPQLVDNDIGCGMSFVELTGLVGRSKSKQFSNPKQLRKLADRLQSIDGPVAADLDAIQKLCAEPLQWGDKHVPPLPVLDDASHYKNLGTIGGGNHFAEVQEFEDLLVDAETLRDEFGIDATRLHLLVHSGSRSLGSHYLRQFCEQVEEQKQQPHKTSSSSSSSSSNSRTNHYAADTNSPLFQEYLSNHETALNFAVRNRHFITKRLLEQIIGPVEHHPPHHRSTAEEDDCGDGDDDDDQDNHHPDHGQTEQPLFQCKIDIHHNFMERVELPTEELQAMRKMEKDQGMFPKEIPSASDHRNDQRQQEESPQVGTNDKQEPPPTFSSSLSPTTTENRRVSGWLHRKGATPTNSSASGLLVIPGSRGTLSYLVQVNPALQHGSGYSLAHGAGRRMTRSKARALHQNQYPVSSQLLQTNLGGVVVCEKKDLVYEEAPASYKDIDRVVGCLAQVGSGSGDGGNATHKGDRSSAGNQGDSGKHGGASTKDATDSRSKDNGEGLVRVLATLRPVLTYKYKDPYSNSRR